MESIPFLDKGDQAGGVYSTAYREAIPKMVKLAGKGNTDPRFTIIWVFSLDVYKEILWKSHSFSCVSKGGMLTTVFYHSFLLSRLTMQLFSRVARVFLLGPPCCGGNYSTALLRM